MASAAAVHLRTAAPRRISSHVHPFHIRRVFAQRLADMYSAEVPQYARLQQLVQQVNEAAPAASKVRDPLIPRHGAIRLASLSDLRDTARLLGVMGMRPVGYYDLAPAGLPIHATAFRSLAPDDLAASPIRLFVSVLRPEVQRIPLVQKLLAKRGSILNERTKQLIVKAESQGGLDEHEGAELATHACSVLKWDGRSILSLEEHRELKGSSGGNLLVDVLGFEKPHINHLTPATGDIDAVQSGMRRVGLQAKNQVEGPPARKHQILLRQTSFLAVEEDISFAGNDGSDTHTARFGEVEQRGAALTQTGRNLYDSVITKLAQEQDLTPAEKQVESRKLFDQAFPDDWHALRKQGLIWVRYFLTPDGTTQAQVQKSRARMSLRQAMGDGLVSWEPIQYEDFLPMSAAGIFQSNLGGNERTIRQEQPAKANSQAREAMRLALPGKDMFDEMELYAFQEAESLRVCCEALGITGRE